MENQNENFPNQWKCPITNQLMTDPVIADDGISYQRASIQNWFNKSNMSPITGLKLSTTNLIPNQALKITIEQLLQKMKELALTKILFKEARKKQVKVDIQNHPQYGKYIIQTSEGKMKLDMVQKNVTDKMVQEIAQCDLSSIQILDLSYNQITDNGFDLLFQNREWPVLEQINLTKNNIHNIHSLHKIPKLEWLMICHNELSQASCTYICEHQWTEITYLYISFKRGINDKCWEKLLTVMKEKFPKLGALVFYQKEDISSDNKEKIATYCKNNDVYL